MAVLVRTHVFAVAAATDVRQFLPTDDDSKYDDCSRQNVSTTTSIFRPPRERRPFRFTPLKRSFPSIHEYYDDTVR